MKKSKLLYIPSGEYVLFRAEKTFTPYFEDSRWHSLWEEKIENIIVHFCMPDTEQITKSRHKIPIDIALNPNEFEIVYEEVK